MWDVGSSRSISSRPSVRGGRHSAFFWFWSRDLGVLLCLVGGGLFRRALRVAGSSLPGSRRFGSADRVSSVVVVGALFFFFFLVPSGSVLAGAFFFFCRSLLGRSLSCVCAGVFLGGGGGRAAGVLRGPAAPPGRAAASLLRFGPGPGLLRLPLSRSAGGLASLFWSWFVWSCCLLLFALSLLAFFSFVFALCVSLFRLVSLSFVSSCLCSFLSVLCFSLFIFSVFFFLFGSCALGGRAFRSCWSGARLALRGARRGPRFRGVLPSAVSAPVAASCSFFVSLARYAARSRPGRFSARAFPPAGSFLGGGVGARSLSLPSFSFLPFFVFPRPARRLHAFFVYTLSTCRIVLWGADAGDVRVRS